MEFLFPYIIFVSIFFADIHLTSKEIHLVLLSTYIAYFLYSKNLFLTAHSSSKVKSIFLKTVADAADFGI